MDHGLARAPNRPEPHAKGEGHDFHETIVVGARRDVHRVLRRPRLDRRRDLPTGATDAATDRDRRRRDANAARFAQKVTDTVNSLKADAVAVTGEGSELDTFATERGFLARMGGSCQTPLAAHATWDGDQLALAALCGTPDGTRVLRSEARGTAGDAVALGEAAADRLLADGAAAIVAACSAAAHP